MAEEVMGENIGIGTPTTPAKSLHISSERILDTLVLAFDLGTHEAGWVLVDSNDEILHLGYWKAPKWSLDSRLRDLMFALECEMQNIHIGEHPAGEFVGKQIHVAYEAPHAQYAKAVLALGQAVGMLKAALWKVGQGGRDPHFLGMPMEVSIAEAKLAVTGYGNASKDDVLHMARALSGCKELNQHQADAYGVARVAWGRLHQQAAIEMAEEE